MTPRPRLHPCTLPTDCPPSFVAQDDFNVQDLVDRLQKYHDVVEMEFSGQKARNNENVGNGGQYFAEKYGRLKWNGRGEKCVSQRPLCTVRTLLRCALGLPTIYGGGKYFIFLSVMIQRSVAQYGIPVTNLFVDVETPQLDTQGECRADTWPARKSYPNGQKKTGFPRFCAIVC